MFTPVGALVGGLIAVLVLTVLGLLNRALDREGVTYKILHLVTILGAVAVAALAVAQMSIGLGVLAGVSLVVWVVT